MSHRSSHVLRRLTIPAPLGVTAAAPVWPTYGASRSVSGVSYPEPAVIMAHRKTESGEEDDRRELLNARKGYTGPSVILGIANPSPSPPPGPPTPSLYAPSPEPGHPLKQRVEQDAAPMYNYENCILPGKNPNRTGAELYAHYMGEHYRCAV
ncbi:hypothetical protein DACRYDRAFT_24547 [Dacryopinax primogenitus]|uniref:Uncharacterized protein n=1 Tax=Dacryopinax primogenitus (strain DJM 731) TaxID=1858805 RepID=M5FRY4_DACPD|nr:uncharacterized protein DACRYDRAFT_24547 [Dacryopinax primogenitus]EJT98528.1 hypothetical protein DACRYDRAFT_24547 [Dacryopinax primogenitus]